MHVLYSYLIHCWGDKGVHTFSKGISLNVGIILLQAFELASSDVAVQQHFCHYTTGPSPISISEHIDSGLSERHQHEVK